MSRGQKTLPMESLCGSPIFRILDILYEQQYITIFSWQDCQVQFCNNPNILTHTDTNIHVPARKYYFLPAFNLDGCCAKRLILYTCRQLQHKFKYRNSGINPQLLYQPQTILWIHSHRSPHILPAYNTWHYCNIFFKKWPAPCLTGEEIINLSGWAFA